MLFDGVTFTATNRGIAAYSGGCLTFGEGHSNARITLLNCTVTGNQGRRQWRTLRGGGGQGLVDSPAPRSATSPSSAARSARPPAAASPRWASRWSIQGLTRLADTGYGPCSRTAIIDCEIEPCGGEAISFGSAGDIYALVSGCTLKGAGNLVNPAWELRLRVQRHPLRRVSRLRDLELARRLLQLQRLRHERRIRLRHRPAHPHRARRRRLRPHLPVTSGRHRLRPVRFRLEEPRPHQGLHLQHRDGRPSVCDAAGTAADWGIDTWRECRYNDFSGSTITGYVRTDGGDGTTTAHVPATKLGYWAYGANIHPTNILPAVLLAAATRHLLQPSVGPFVRLIPLPPTKTTLHDGLTCC